MAPQSDELLPPGSLMLFQIIEEIDLIIKSDSLLDLAWFSCRLSHYMSVPSGS